MQNVKDLYSSDLANITVSSNNGYDIRIHAVQTALFYMGFNDVDEPLVNDQGVQIDKSELKFGYYCEATSQLIFLYQKAQGLKPTGKLDKKTWDHIFNNLLEYFHAYIVKVDSNKIEIIETQWNPNLNDPDGNGTNNGDENEYLDPDDIGANRIPDTYPTYPENPDMSRPNGDKTNSNSTNGVNQGNGEDPKNNNGVPNGGSLENLLPNINNLPPYLQEIINDKFYGNMNGEESWDDRFLQVGGMIDGMYNGDDYYSPYGPDDNGEYNYINDLLSNSIYKGNIDTSPIWVSTSKEYGEIGKYNGEYETSQHSLPFFNKDNTKEFRRSRFTISIVYGAKGEKSKKIVDVLPRTVTQEIDASGNPIYDIYEFIARDVVESDNKLK